jgi:hypothetical protein
MEHWQALKVRLMTHQCSYTRDSGLAGVAYTSEFRLPSVAYVAQYLLEIHFCGLLFVVQTHR